MTDLVKVHDRRSEAADAGRSAGAARQTDGQTTTRALPDLVRVTLLGSWSLTGVPRDAPVPLMVRRLVTYLSLRGPTPREEIAAVLWPEAASERASGSLRTALWRLRGVHPRLVECDGESARLHPDVRVDVDELAEDVRRLDAGTMTRPLEALPRYVLDGELAVGWYDDWLLLERERVRQLRLHALEGLALALVEEGRFSLALEAALAAVRCEPLRESAHRVVVVVHLREGNRSEALRHLEAYRVLLDRELGVPPSPALLGLLDAGTRVPSQRRDGRC